MGYPYPARHDRDSQSSTVANADEFARVLLTKYTVRDLEIVKPSLDESFVQLTDRAAQEA